MAFDQDSFLPLSAMSNSDAPRHYTYITADGNEAVIASGYFDDIALTLNQGDVIWVIGDSGAVEYATLVIVKAITGGVVTTFSSSFVIA